MFEYFSCVYSWNPILILFWIKGRKDWAVFKIVAANPAARL